MIHVFVDSLRTVSRFMWKVLKKVLNDSKGFLKHETYFDIHSLVTAELEELWSWYCFEKVALGVETLQECSTESTLRIFLAQKLPAVQKRFWRIFEVNLL